MTDRIRIYCIEGCHGSGKTNVVSELSRRGHQILDENFINMPQLGIKPQSFTMELIWISHWFERALELKKTPNSKVYFADRSPYSAVLYAEYGLLFKPIIAQNILDLKRAGIDIINVYVEVDEDVLWGRISDRLQKEPERQKYREDSRQHMTSVLDFYKSHDDLWNYTVNNTANDIEFVIQNILQITSHSPLAASTDGAI